MVDRQQQTIYKYKSFAGKYRVDEGRGETERHREREREKFMNIIIETQRRRGKCIKMI